jgi:hypothetical protein
MRNLTSWIRRLAANWITLLGAVFTTLSGLALALFLFVDLVVPGRNPYAGSFVIIGLAAMFAAGLALLPVGFWIERRKHPPGHDAVDKVVDATLRDEKVRNRILIVAAFTLVNVLLMGFAGKSSMEYMDSPEFCGAACHKVMQPEWDAYKRSPHSHVDCVECHIGSGTTSYIKAKANGMRQIFKLATNTYSRPVPNPVAGMRSDTCVAYHGKKNIGDKLKIYPHYQPDQTNSPAFNAFLLHVGGEDPKTGKFHGIHWHANPNIQISYQLLDEKRTQIGKITVRENGKQIAEYLPPVVKPVVGERTMACIDCHNRPTHIFDASPAAALDKAIATGRIDVKIPFVAQIGAELLLRPDARRQDAEAFFREGLAEAFRKKTLAVSTEQVAQTAKVLADLYQLNVYPDMKLGWGSYRNNLGHAGDGGCFRCHDKEHSMKLPDGTVKTMSQDCDGCHERLASDEDPKNLDETMKMLLPKPEQ